ncbi:MAG: hypothetical protein RXP27_01035 [Nitrososphaeria archaeon]
MPPHRSTRPKSDSYLSIQRASATASSSRKSTTSPRESLIPISTATATFPQRCTATLRGRSPSYLRSTSSDPSPDGFRTTKTSSGRRDCLRRLSRAIGRLQALL